MRSAANCSASRCRAGSAAKASASSAGASSRSAIDAACIASKRLVYSSTAASPRCCTSARMPATACSTPVSVSADQCSRAASAASKPASVVARRRGWAERVMSTKSGGGGDGAGEDVDQAAYRFLLELERGLVDDQARADLHDAFDLDQVVGLERVAGGNEIDDGIGQ